MDGKKSWYFSIEDFSKFPSRLDGISEEREKGYRRKTCFFIDEAGNALGMPKLTVATAHVFFHRFFAHQSFKQHDRFLIATACLLLAGKVEESPKKLHHVVTVCHSIRYRGMEQRPLDPQSEEFERQKERILMCERILLHTIDFDLCLEHPFKYLIEICKKLKQKGIIGKDTDSRQHVASLIGQGKHEDNSRQFAQNALNFVNDSMRTSCCLQFPPHRIAAAGVFLAVLFDENIHANATKVYPDWLRLLMVDPQNRSGYGMVQVIAQDQELQAGFAKFESDLNSICEQIMELYETTRSERHREKFNKMRLELMHQGRLSLSISSGGLPPSGRASWGGIAPVLSPSPARPTPSPARSITPIPPSPSPQSQGGWTSTPTQRSRADTVEDGQSSETGGSRRHPTENTDNKETGEISPSISHPLRERATDSSAGLDTNGGKKVYSPSSNIQSNRMDTESSRKKQKVEP